MHFIPKIDTKFQGMLYKKFGNFIIKVHILRKLWKRFNHFMLALLFEIFQFFHSSDVNIRTKYVINGKHVWAKKYARKPLYARIVARNTSNLPLIRDVNIGTKYINGKHVWAKKLSVKESNTNFPNVILHLVFRNKIPTIKKLPIFECH